MKNRFLSTDAAAAPVIAQLPAAPTSVVKPLVYKVELITPLFGGGTVAGIVDEKLPFRAKSIRGQLRFWWRLLAREGAFGAPDFWKAEKAKGTEDNLLFKRWERQVWGGITAKASSASRVGVRIEFDRQVSLEAFEELQEVRDRNGKTVTDRHGKPVTRYETTKDFKGKEYALFPAKHEQASSRLPLKLAVAPAAKMPMFKLIIAVPESAPASNSIETQVRETIRWWATFGGVGSRTRRGLGSVRVKLENTVVCIDLQNGFSILPAKGLAHNVRVVKGREKPSADEAWRHAVGLLRDFRQKPGTARKHKPKDKPKDPPGRSFWPEPDVIREATGCHLDIPGKTHAPTHAFAKKYHDQTFSRALFGLPVNVQFKDQQRRDRSGNLVPAEDKKKCDPSNLEVNACGQKRMASPLIVKACSQPDGKFYPIAVLLPSSEGLVDTLKVSVAGKSFVAWSSDMAADLEAGKAFDPVNQNSDGVAGKASTPLEAFLNYFGKNAV